MAPTDTDQAGKQANRHQQIGCSLEAHRHRVLQYRPERQERHDLRRSDIGIGAQRQVTRCAGQFQVVLSAGFMQRVAAAAELEVLTPECMVVKKLVHVVGDEFR